MAAKMNRREFLQSTAVVGVIPSGVKAPERPRREQTTEQNFMMHGGVLPVKPDQPYQTRAYLPENTVAFSGKLVYRAGRYPYGDPSGSYAQNVTPTLNGERIRKVVYEEGDSPTVYKAHADVSDYIQPGWNRLEIDAKTKGYLTAGIYGTVTVTED